MADLSSLVLPVKNPSTGEISPQTFNISGSGGGGVIPVDPATTPTENGSIWITTT